MPFKDAAARRAYMKKYQAEYRQGKRRAEAGQQVTGRTLKSRASAEKKRKKLWALENHEWRMQRQRERRRLARQHDAQLLLSSVPQGSARRPRTSDSSCKKTSPKTPRKAA